MQQLGYISIWSCSSGQRSDTFGHYPKAEKKSKTTDEITWNNQAVIKGLKKQITDWVNYPWTLHHTGDVLWRYSEKGGGTKTLIAKWARYPDMNKSSKKKIKEWAKEHVKKCSTSLWGDASQNHNVILLQFEGLTPKDRAYSQEAETGGPQV